MSLLTFDILYYTLTILQGFSGLSKTEALTEQLT